MLECDVICIGIRVGRLQRVHLRLRSNWFRQDLHHGGYVTRTVRACEHFFGTFLVHIYVSVRALLDARL